MLVPAPADKIPPCEGGCPNGNDVRGWLAIIAQRHRTGDDTPTALRRAWERLVEGNPFPATMGRICPHPCEAGCSRREKDGAVAIHALERFLGDWAIERGLRLKREPGAPEREPVGVIGGGPAGLSFAYQMVRRGYRVTLYERSDGLGGMLRHAIPGFRLPARILDAEIARIVDLGVEIRLRTAVGRDLGSTELGARHAALFLGIGAQRGLRLGVPGEPGPGLLTGIDFLAAVKRGERPAIGRRVVVVGGGNTAIDAARTARRLGASVVLLYRRSREEMPAIREEVDEALAEGVRLVLLAEPVRLVRDGARLEAVEARCMRLGESDASGRRRPDPIPGSSFLLPADAVIAAVSQEAERDLLGRLPDEWLWTGGDVRALGIATMAIAQGRLAAEAVHRRLRRIEEPEPRGQRLALVPGEVKPPFYPERARVAPPTLAVAARLAEPERETVGTIDEAAFLDEVARCFSCGLCFGCQHCFTYCNGYGFTRVEQPSPGRYFALALDRCERCGKCIDLCPSGYLSETRETSRPT